MQNLVVAGVTVCFVLGVYACADSGSGSDGTSDGEAPTGFGGSGAVGAGGSAAASPGTGGAVGGPPLPPEMEIESSFQSPVATSRFVWTANPESGRIALVDVQSLEVMTVEAGFEPTHLAAVPDSENPDADRAIVINVRSHDATYLRFEDGVLVTDTVPVHERANRWTISPSGRWAIAWSDASGFESPDPTEGFQDITVIDLSVSPPGATRLSVGYRPTDVVITADEARAYATTEPGVSVVELEAGPEVTHDVALTRDPLDDPASRDVSITADGSFALVRRDTSADINVVSLPMGEISTVTLSGLVTDLDLSSTGRFAVAAVRDNAEVVLLQIPAIFDDPTSFVTKSIDGEVFGSVVLGPSGARATLFTNAIPNDRLTIIDTVLGQSFLAERTIALKAPVQAVFPTADDSHAVALLQPALGSSRLGAFSVVPIGPELPPKIQGTDAPPRAVAMSPDSTRAIVTTRDDGRNIHEAYLVRMPELRVDRVLLPSPPLATGIMSRTGVGFVAQRHPEGRITFVELDAGKIRTLTGFELDSQVVDEN